MKITKLLFPVFIILLLAFSTPVHLKAQTNYEKGWQALDNAQIDDAIKYFKKASKDDEHGLDANLALTLLYSPLNKPEVGSFYFMKYFEEAENPFDATYALWFEDAVAGYSGYKEPYQFKLLEGIYEHPDNKGKFDAAILYHLGTNYLFKFDKENTEKYYKEISAIRNWQFVGPFDNVMNSGFDKDFGVLAHPESDAVFKSKYGADIKWFNAPGFTHEGYFFKDMNFTSSNCLIYAQSFVNAPSAQDVIMKVGYSGSLKIWLNDQLIYSELDKRNTEMDYYRFKCHLNQGYNRILVQLGDYDESDPNFIVRLTDVNDNNLDLEASATPEAYTKSNDKAEQISYFAIDGLKKLHKEQPDNLLYDLLLSMAYKRSNELDDAESILKAAVEKHPNNYLLLRNIVFLYMRADNNTEQNRYYEIFKKLYPDDRDILKNEIDDYIKEKNKEKMKESIDKYLDMYGTDYKKRYYTLIQYGVNEEYEEMFSAIDDLYEHYPLDYFAVNMKYNLEKSLHSDPVASNNILEKYLEEKYNYTFLNRLASNYIDEGHFDDAIALINKSNEMVQYDMDSYKTIISYLIRQKKYKDAIDICNMILSYRPYDYYTLTDMASYQKLTGNKKKAIEYYEKAIKYFPFSFEINEKIRELKGDKVVLSLIPELEPEDVIKDYEKNFETDVKRDYDIVLDDRSIIIFKSKATGTVRRYILRMNTEDAIEDWQQLSFSADYNKNIILNKAQTIKQNGNKIDAERSGSQAVFTNLEVGDYIYVYYTETQVTGGKSSLFIWDKFSLNSYFPSFQFNYNVFAEEGVSLHDTMINGNIQPEITNKHGFNRYTWSVTAPEIIQDETYEIPFSDIANKVHVAVDNSWSDIVEWYWDLSEQQIRADYTIKKLVSELFDGKNLDEQQKVKAIYNFVCKNIQYSSIDFRQSGYIPQRASKVYHSRLGDCKDMSTLFVSLARETGIKANLVLVNTRDNGAKDVLLPSLDFNHCIVKVYFSDGHTQYLELTDPYLPYGYLKYYHEGAAILEIEKDKPASKQGLETLHFNPGYKMIRNRIVDINVDKDLKLNVTSNTIKTGTLAGGMYESYYNLSETERYDKMKKAVASDFNSMVTITNLEFKQLEALRDSAIYTYSYTVENDVLKVGSFRSLKVPFSDILAELKIFEDNERTLDFDFLYYENTDIYDQTLNIKLDPAYSYTEIPENIHYEFQGTKYDLTFEKISNNEMKIHRVYDVNRKIIRSTDFKAFEEFIKKVLEAENTNIVFK